MNNKIEIIYKKDTDDFFQYWNNFLQHNNHSFDYILNNIEYYYSYCKNIIDDYSFVIINNNIVSGICFLPIENINNTISISINDGYIPAPLSLNTHIEKDIFRIIDKIAIQNNIQKIKMQIDSKQTFNKVNQFNFLKKYNFIETNTLSLNIDLSLCKELLWRNLSKRYKSIINKYTKNTKNTLFIMNKDNANWQHQEAYWNLHCQIAGKYARNLELFKEQFKLIKNGFATLFYIKDNNNYTHFTLFFHYNYYAVSASSVSIDSEDRPPLSHYVLWNANLYFKNLHYTLIQYGQPSGYCKLGGIDDISDEKGLSIAHFKRNMGAVVTTQYRGIKFYDKKLLKNYLDNFYLEFVNNLDEK